MARADKRARMTTATGSRFGSSDEIYLPSPTAIQAQQGAFSIHILRENRSSMPVQMEVNDPNDPQLLPPSPTSQDRPSGRFRLRSLIHPDDQSPYENESDPDFQPRSSEQSASDSAHEEIHGSSSEGIPVSRSSSIL